MAKHLRREKEHPSAHALPRDGGLRVENGRIVGPTLNDPAAKKELSAFKQALRKDPEKLRQWYIDAGVLTPAGKLSKKYGG